MKSHKLNIYLHNLSENPEYTALFSRVNQLNKIERALESTAAIPKQLTKYCQLGPLSHNRLTLFAENAAIAAKLKHITPTIIEKLIKQGVKVDSIKVQVVSPSRADHTNSSITRAKNSACSTKSTISSQGIECLNHLVRSLPDSELKNSIRKLIKNHS